MGKPPEKKKAPRSSKQPGIFLLENMGSSLAAKDDRTELWSLASRDPILLIFLVDVVPLCQMDVTTGSRERKKASYGMQYNAMQSVTMNNVHFIH